MADVQRDIVLSNLSLDLRQESGTIPFTPIVHSLDVRLANPALIKAVETVLSLSRSRLPVEVDFEDAEFIPGGAEVTITAGLNRFLKVKAIAVVGISAQRSDSISVEIREIRTLGKLSIEGMVSPMIEKALDKAALRSGITRDPGRKQGLLVNPDQLMASQGVPLEFAQPGGWTVECVSRELTARYETV